MDHFGPTPNHLLPFQATPANVVFQAGISASGPLRNASVPTTSIGEPVMFEDTYLLQHDMMQDMSWGDAPDLRAALCIPDDPYMLSWGLASAPLTYATSHGTRSGESSGNAPSSPKKSQPASSKRTKAEERPEKRRMQNRAAQRHFRDRQKVAFKDNVTRIEKMENEIQELSGENEKMEEMIKALRRKCAGLESERKALRQEKRLLEGENDADNAHMGTEAADEIAKLVKGVIGGDVGTREDECRWHWMKVKSRKIEEKGDWRDVPSIFV